MDWQAQVGNSLAGLSPFFCRKKGTLDEASMENDKAVLAENLPKMGLVLLSGPKVSVFFWSLVGQEDVLLGFWYIIWKILLAEVI